MEEEKYISKEAFKEWLIRLNQRYGGKDSPEVIESTARKLYESKANIKSKASISDSALKD